MGEKDGPFVLVPFLWSTLTNLPIGAKDLKKAGFIVHQTHKELHLLSRKFLARFSVLKFFSGKIILSRVCLSPSCI